MRVAIAHDWLDSPGGAENVLQDLLALFPTADVWTLWNTWKDSKELDARIFTSPLDGGRISKHKALALPLMPLIWRTLPASDYDLVLSDSSAFAHAVRFRKSTAVYAHYIHTPARYLWSPELDGRGHDVGLMLPRLALRKVDLALTVRHRHLACNSVEVQARIRRFWKKDARVIYPGVDVEFFSSPPHPPNDLPFERYVIGISRWIRYKRLDLVIAAADRIGLPAVIVGSGPEEAALRRAAESARVPVHFEKGADRSRVRELLSGAMALCYPAHEDFGIVPVEAQAAGVPVVGLARGGTAESVKHGETGYLVDHATPEALGQALEKTTAMAAAACVSQAQQFSNERFRAEMRGWISDVLASDN